MLRSTIVLLSGLLLPQAAYAAPPKELYGKSVSVTWTETREQRPAGEQAWRQVVGTVTLNMYVSEAGRVFNNVSYATRRGSAERQGEIAGSGKRSINFNGRSLLVLMPYGSAGATRIVADIDAGFASCSAQVTRARESEGAIIRFKSGITNNIVEIKSNQVGGISCSIRAGNVFAN
ncbi:hypothetical protein [Bradyrhizobium sp.]|uniref:hypothetical protein n=1 Tax=Bradyrhizobium sp. TaxID=376 RepID=UPI0025BA7319|nr:hypothetical protein [Bradyrhizobium sp.]